MRTCQRAPNHVVTLFNSIARPIGGVNLYEGASLLKSTMSGMVSGVSGSDFSSSTNIEPSTGETNDINARSAGSCSRVA